MATIFAGVVFLSVFGVVWWRTRPPNDGAEKVSRVHGLTEAVLIEEYGEPDRRLEFPMSEAYGEFRIALFNTYPPNSPDLAEIMIREYTWTYWRYSFTAWLHAPDGEWVVLDTLQYSNDVQF